MAKALGSGRRQIGISASTKGVSICKNTCTNFDTSSRTSFFFQYLSSSFVALCQGFRSHHDSRFFCGSPHLQRRRNDHFPCNSIRPNMPRPQGSPKPICYSCRAVASDASDAWMGGCYCQRGHGALFRVTNVGGELTSTLSHALRLSSSGHPRHWAIGLEQLEIIRDHFQKWQTQERVPVSL